jgi:N-acyl homoserine lactone hydrolase
MVRFIARLTTLAACAVLSLLVLGCAGPTGRPVSAPNAAVQRLYIMDCGEGVAGDISRWSGVNPGKSQPFSDSCYLIRHRDGWMLWDTGLPDALASKPGGEAPADPRAIHWYRPKRLASQLQEIGVAAADIRFVAVSHSHPDHIGNLGQFTNATIFVQRAEYDWPSTTGPRFGPELKVTKLEGDYDVFGDGSVRIISTPGHTPGHQSLLVKLVHTGAVVLSGDAVHFKENWDNRRVPSINFNKDQTSASMQRLADIMARENAQLWINHDKSQRDAQKLSPGFYE